MNLPEIIVPLSIEYDVTPPPSRKPKPKVAADVRWKALYAVVGKLATQCTSDKPSHWARLAFDRYEVAHRATASITTDMRWKLWKLDQTLEIQTRLVEYGDQWMVYVRVTPKGWPRERYCGQRQDNSRPSTFEDLRLAKEEKQRQRLLCAFGIGELQQKENSDGE